MVSLKKRIFVTILLSCIGIIAVIAVLYFYINHIVVAQEVAKARLMSKTIYYYREYLSKVAPKVKLNDKNLSVFACTPAYSTNQVAKVMRQKEHIYVRQVSDRWRNPDDKPVKPELAAIEYFKKHPKAKEFWQIHNPHKGMTLGGEKKHIFYAYPLYVEKSCLVCHGKPYVDVPANMYKLLVKKYGDRAFNYKVGDLRGIISIRLPFQVARDEIISVFVVISVILFVAFILGTFIFYRLSTNITSDIDKILQFFKEKISKNIYEKFTEKMHFDEFNILKEQINDTISVIKNYQDILSKNKITNLPNRSKFLAYLEKNDSPILVLNVDKFREINSYFNTDVGDKLIKEIGERLKKLSEKYNFKIFHLDIDEFALIPEIEISTKDDMKKYAEEILQELEKEYIIDGNEIMVRFRIGISFFKKDYLRAEIALNKAKEIKKDIVFGSEAIGEMENYGEHIKWLRKLKKAIESRRIVPFYQPIVDREGRIVKHEALVRMIDEDGKIVSPFFFIDVAKKSRLYIEISKIMFNRVLEAIKKYKVSISMNLTVEDIDDEEMRNYILEKIKTFEYPHLLTFEIVENEDIRESELSKEFLLKVKEYGIAIYIDDFGSGYANFDYLLNLHPNGVKIDGSLIKNILTDKKSQVMVSTLISFAKQSNMKVVAEYVENREIFEMLKEMDVDYFQGYYFSAPTPEIKDKV